MVVRCIFFYHVCLQQPIWIWNDDEQILGMRLQEQLVNCDFQILSAM